MPRSRYVSSSAKRKIDAARRRACDVGSFDLKTFDQTTSEKWFANSIHASLSDKSSRCFLAAASPLRMSSSSNVPRKPKDQGGLVLGR